MVIRMIDYIDIKYYRVFFISKLHMLFSNFFKVISLLKFLKDKKIFYSFILCGLRDTIYLIFFKKFDVYSDVYWIGYLFYFNDRGLNDRLIWLSFQNSKSEKIFSFSYDFSFELYYRKVSGGYKKHVVRFFFIRKFLSYLYFSWGRSNLKNKYFNSYFKNMKKNFKWYWNSRH